MTGRAHAGPSRAGFLSRLFFNMPAGARDKDIRPWKGRRVGPREDRLSITLLLLLFGGCCHCPPAPPPPTAYFGPTLSIEQVIERVNANNQRISSLWSNISEFHVLLVDDKGKSHAYDGNGGELLYLKPHDLYLRGTVVGAGEVFSLGTTLERYWLKVVIGADTLWTGTYANLARADTTGLPFRPDLVLEVLGVSDIDANLMKLPSPVMRFDNYQDAYVLVWSAPMGNHWVAREEIWYDRKTLLPRHVLLYDPSGRMMVEARLYDPQLVPADQEHDPNPGDPKIATRFELYFPESKTNLNLTLVNVSLTNKRVPSERTFARLVANLEHPGVNHIIDLDRGTPP